MSPADRVRTVMLATSDESIDPAGREFGRSVRLLPGSGTNEAEGGMPRFWDAMSLLLFAPSGS
jgi:hypothetical protein